MKLIFDTHVWLWLVSEPARLSKKFRNELSAGKHDLVFSSVCAFETAVKHSLGKLALPMPASDFVRQLRTLTGCETLTIDVPHAVMAGTLPWHHKDPFDRLLIAQALVEDVALVSADQSVRLYNAKVIAPS